MYQYYLQYTCLLQASFGMDYTSPIVPIDISTMDAVLLFGHKWLSYCKQVLDLLGFVDMHMQDGYNDCGILALLMHLHYVLINNLDL